MNLDFRYVSLAFSWKVVIGVDLRIVVGLVGKVEIFLRIAFDDVVPALEKDLCLGPFPKPSRQFMVQILNSVKSSNLLAEPPLLAHTPSEVPARAQLQG